jgi:[ribosomal protein S5]-alanine N-acetyltransferase
MLMTGALPPLPRLHGRQVVLRPFGAADITPAYVGWLNDPRVVRYSNQRFRHHDAAGCAAYLAGFDGGDNVFASVRRAADDRAVGTMTAYRSRHHGTADIGILIGECSVWGQGFGQDAWDTMLGWLAAQAGLRKLTCGTLACNAAMRRLAERSGMALEATRRAQEIVDGTPQDMLLYARFTDAA